MGTFACAVCEMWVRLPVLFVTCAILEMWVRLLVLFAKRGYVCLCCLLKCGYVCLRFLCNVDTFAGAVFKRWVRLLALIWAELG